ncbi:IS3 family transposase ISBce15 [Sporomusa rhizae]|uniref:IS3 family transposase n=1 Tax=Sporomusa rhizae TaxID=357999 RepID=UPI00352B9E9E
MKANIKYAAIYRHKEQFSITAMCNFFEVSRSGYYEFVKRMNRTGKDQIIAGLISECQKRTHGIYGYRRVKIWLSREAGLKVNHNAILRIMNKYGILSQIRRRKKYKKYGQQLHKYENILNRQFKAEKPNQKWVTDISYIHTSQGVLYLSMIKDLFDDSIISYQTGTEQTVRLVTETIKRAMIKEEVADGLQLHSDQGFQYTSTAYFNLTKEYGITPSMSRRGNCLDNACAENFFGILKSECIHRVRPKTFEEARELIDEYIHFYNHERIQLKTRLTPFEKRCQSA